MAKTLPRLSRKYLDQPQFITSSKFKEIADVLDSKDRSHYKAAYQAAIDNDFELEKVSCSLFDGYYKARELGEKPSYGVLSVEGPTTYKSTGWEGLCGGCSYESLIKQMESFVEQGMTEVFMLVDSGGGEAYQMQNSSRTLRKLADDNGIKLVGYVDGMAASAGYGLLTSCHEIITNPEAEVGSIGVVISLMNNSEQLSKEGLKRTFITAGGSKVPFDADGEFKEDFLTDLQGKVDVLYEQFTSHVSTMRGGLISQDTVKSTEAKMLSSDKALDIGLVDKVMELQDFKKEYLSGYKSVGTQNKNQKETLMSDPKVVETPQLSAEEIANMQAELAQFKAAKVEATKASLTASLESKPFLAECQGSLVEFFMNAEVGEDVKSLMNSVIAGADAEMSNLVAEHSAELATVTEEKELAVKSAEESVLEAAKLAESQVAEAQLEAEKVKTEFATTNFSVKAETKETVETEKKPDLAAYILSKHKAKG